MKYREWQFEFSKMMGIPYHYLKEVGDAWFNLINGEGAKEFLKRRI
jgi:hypothetical protein